MAQEEEEHQWSRSTEEALEKLDSSMLQRYKLSLRDIMSNPVEYSTKPGINDTINSMKREIDSYFSEILLSHAQEQKTLDAELKRIGDIYTKIDSIIESKAKELNIPYINPMEISRETSGEETIMIYDFEESIATLVNKLVENCVYVADLSTDYKDNPIGYWLFSGSKSRALSVNPPQSPLIEIQGSHDEINTALDSAMALF